ncbi:MAG: hypothetical protein HUU08_11230 [Candidatus Brocadia sp.]|nr:hypothetical protein [Candidatus Brocadia sp.]
MKRAINLLGFVFLFFIQGYFFNETKFVSIAKADDNWKNWYAVTWRDTSANIVKYTKQMGYDYVGVRDWDFSQYKNNPDCSGMKYFVVNPHMLSTMYDNLPSRNSLGTTVGGGLVINTSLSYTQAQIDWYNQRMVWKSNDPFPNNLASGYFPDNNSIRFNSMWDVQQQAVIDEMIESIIKHIRKYESQSLPFTFAGYILDVPRISGDFFYFNGSQQFMTNLSHWTGTDSGLIHGTITHEYSTYTDGWAAFYKQLNTRLRQEFPGAKWIIEPTLIYSDSSPDDWVYSVRNRADKDELTPDFLSQEEGTYHTTEFVDNDNIFNSGMNITKDMVGNSQSNDVNEDINRLIAAKAGINGAWYNWFGRWGGFRSMPNFKYITEVYPRLKLIRCIPNWDNLNNVPLYDRSWDGSVYRSTKSYISSDVMYSHHPKTGKLFAVFNTKNGVIKLNAGEKIDSVNRVNGYFEEAEDGSADVDIFGDEIRLKSNVGIDVDANNGQIKGKGYIFTLSTGGAPRVTTGTASGVTSNSAILNGTVNAGGLSTTAWFEYGLISGSYDSRSSIQNMTGSSDTAVNVSVNGLSAGKTYYYRLVAQNAVGTTNGAEMAFTTPDTTAPNCSISINNGNSYTKSTGATLSLSATDDIGVTGYYLSTSSTIPLATAAGWTAVTSTIGYSANVPYTLSNGDGNKTLYVWYKDAAGNVSTTASDSITLDTTVPIIAITNPTSEAIYTTTNNTINLNGSASDETSDISSVTWNNSRGGNGIASGTTSWTIDGISLLSGENVIVVTVTDGAGYTGNDKITVTYGIGPKATTGPVTNVTSDSAILGGTVNAGGLSTSAWFEYGKISGSYGSKSSTQNITGSSDTAINVSVKGLSAGKTYYYRLVAQNAVGTTNGVEMAFATPDTTAPNCSISINNGDTYTKSTGVTLSLSATDDIGVTGYYLSTNSTVPLATAAGWTAVTSTTGYNANVPYTLSNGDGNKTLYVWYKDAAGNVSTTASDSIILDAIAPLIAITSPTTDDTYMATSSTISLGGSASDGTSGVINVTWSNSRGGSGTASGTTSWSISGMNLSSGDNIITVTATDGVNNIGIATITITSNLLTLYTLDEGTGMVANDSSGNGNNGMVNGATWTTGKSTGALSFNGISSHVSLSNSLSSFSEFTASAWVKITDFVAIRGIFTSGGKNGKGFRFRVNKDGSVWLLMAGGGKYDTLTTSSRVIKSGAFYHISVSGKSGQYMRIYVNGILIKEKTTTQTIDAPTTPGYIGTSWSTSSELMNGTIDDVRIYDRILSVQEVQGLYNQ